jgi:hypothetical protein
LSQQIAIGPPTWAALRVRLAAATAAPDDLTLAELADLIDLMLQRLEGGP